MAISSISGRMQTTFFASPQNTSNNPLVSAISTQATITKQLGMGTDETNTTAGGADNVFSFNQAITAGSSATIDLNAMTNLLAQTAQALARIKGWQIRLLSAADSPTLTPAPTATSTVTVTNNGPATPHPLNFRTGGSGLTVALTGSGAVTAVAIGAAGSGYPKSATFIVSPVQTGGSGCIFMVTTNSSGVPTAVTFITGAGGAGYTAATVPTVVVGHFTLLTSEAMMYVDNSGAGQLVSSSNNNIKILNNDGTNAVTVEISVFGGTT